ncbi:MAG: IS30 family transposase, partial [bacterium]|nr:IS30 family transposase [bacterium]
MKKIYKQLSIEEREIIQLGVWAKKPIRIMAQELGRSASTVSRELRRNCPRIKRVYLPRLAEARAKSRIMKRGKRERLKNERIRDYVKTMLRNNYSPEQIAGRIGFDLPGQTISYEAIYNYIYAQYHRGGYGKCVGDDLRIYLKRRHKTRHPKHIPFRPQRLKITDAISISERPIEIELRRELGHWEGDSIVSKQSKYGLNTLVERKSGLV